MNDPGLWLVGEVFQQTRGIPDICHFFYTGKIFGEENLHRNLHSKLPVYTVNCQFTQQIANFSR